MSSSFLLRARTHYSFTFNFRFLYELKHKVCLSKTVCGIFHIWFRFVFIKVYIFDQQNEWAFWLQKFIIPFKIKIIKKQHTVFLPDLWSPTRSSMTISKFNDICMSWSSPKTDLVKKLLNLENRSFEKLTFSQ